MDGRAEQTGPASSVDDTTDQTEAAEIHERLNQVRARIDELALESDARKAGVGRALGAAVFLLLIGAGAAYDLVTDNVALRVALGVTRETLTRVAYACGLAAVALLAYALMRSRFRVDPGEAELAELERELSDLVDRNNSV